MVLKTHASYKYVSTHFEQVTNKKHSMDKMVKGRSEPTHILQVLEVIANVKNINIDELSDVIYQNTLSVFFPNNKLKDIDSNNNNCISNDITEWKAWLIKQQQL